MEPGASQEIGESTEVATNNKEKRDEGFKEEEYWDKIQWQGGGGDEDGSREIKSSQTRTERFGL